MIKYVGVNDHNIDLFEGQYKVPNGVSYNSYVLIDDKIAIMDTVDINFYEEWSNNIEKVLDGKYPDYLIISHMEPDHSACIEKILNKYPNMKLVTNIKAYKMIGQFFPKLVINNYLEVKENDTLSLGNHNLKFIFAPMVHWPEVMMTYDLYTKSLFSADAFGKFGALDTQDNWMDEARRYYIGIVGKYGKCVQALFDKLSKFEIKSIYPLHGPVLNDNLSYYLDLYNKWSTYTPEDNGVCIVYASIYGNTKEAAIKLKNELKNINSEIYDLARCDIHQAIASAFKYEKLVIACPTYNAGLFPKVLEFIHGLLEREYQNRMVSIIENGTWASMVKKQILKMFDNSKGINFIDCDVSIKSAINDDTCISINNLAKKLSE